MNFLSGNSGFDQDPRGFTTIFDLKISKKTSKTYIIKGGPKVSTPFRKSMISITNLYAVIDQNMSFCRGRSELSSEKKIIRNR